MWAVLLCVLMILAAATSSHAAVPHGAVTNAASQLAHTIAGR